MVSQKICIPEVVDSPVRDYVLITSVRGRNIKTRLVRIGNSRGIRLAKTVIEQAGIEDEVEIRVEPGTIIITAISSPRAGWAQAAAKHSPGGLLDAGTSTRFDEDEWEW